MSHTGVQDRSTLEKEAKVAISRNTFWFIALVAVGFLIRFHDLNSRISEPHSFRQAQTALTVQWMVSDGLRLWDYQTPLFGPPWQVPFEFPIYQLSCAIVARLGLFTFEASCRIVAILYFFSSTWALSSLCKRWFSCGMLSQLVVLAYVWAPFNVIWSRTVLIDYAAVSFALWYLRWTIYWLDNPTILRYALYAIFFGCMAHLTKVTSLVLVLIPMVGTMLLYGGSYLRHRVGSQVAEASLWRASRPVFICILIIGIPISASYWWLSYADGIKGASPATQWLTSEHLKGWNFTTWSQLSDWHNWRSRLGENSHYFFPRHMVFLPILALLALWSLGLKERIYFGLLMAGALTQFCVFFNLYVVHNYYSIGVAPAVAVLTGVSVYYLLYIIGRGRVTVVVAFALLFSYDALTSQRVLDLSHASDAFNAQQGPSIEYLQPLVQDHTNPDEFIIIADNDWSSYWPLMLKRRAFMLNWATAGTLREIASDSRCAGLICYQDHPEVSKQWGNTVELGTAPNGLRFFKRQKVARPSTISEDFVNLIQPSRRLRVREILVHGKYD